MKKSILIALSGSFAILSGCSVMDDLNTKLSEITHSDHNPDSVVVVDKTSDMDTDMNKSDGKICPLRKLGGNISGKDSHKNQPLKEEHKKHSKSAQIKSTPNKKPESTQKTNDMVLKDLRYTMVYGNKGIGGAAVRKPGNIHVLSNIPTEYEIWSAQINNSAIELWQSRKPSQEKVSINKEEKLKSDLYRIQKKYCNNPDSLTDEEKRLFETSGGVKAIPQVLAETCNFEK